MWNNGNDCGCLWIILIIILLMCCCGNGSGNTGNACTCHHNRGSFGCSNSGECCC